MDAFYYECGFRLSYQCPDFIDGISSHILNANFKGKNKPSFTKDEQKVYVRYHTIMNTLPTIPDMDEQDALFLAGRLSGLDKLNSTPPT